jgi:hypothetical protein
MSCQRWPYCAPAAVVPTRATAARPLHRRHHILTGEAGTLESLAYINHQSGNHHQATDNYIRTVAVFRELDTTYDIADTYSRRRA